MFIEEEKNKIYEHDKIFMLPKYIHWGANMSMAPKFGKDPVNRYKITRTYFGISVLFRLVILTNLILKILELKI